MIPEDVHIAAITAAWRLMEAIEAEPSPEMLEACRAEVTRLVRLLEVKG